jgi:hypothetical protein
MIIVSIMRCWNPSKRAPYTRLSVRVGRDCAKNVRIKARDTVCTRSVKIENTPGHLSY